MTITDLELKTRLSTIKDVEVSPEIEGLNTETIIESKKDFAISFDLEYHVDYEPDGYEFQYAGDHQSERSVKYAQILMPFETVFLCVNWIEIGGQKVTVLNEDGEEIENDDLIDIVESVLMDKVKVYEA